MAARKNGLWNRLNEREKSNGNGKDPNWNAWIADLEDEYPNIRQFLTGRPGPGGNEGGTLQFFCDHQTPKIRLCDRHNGNVAFVTGIGFQELLRATEDGLATDSIGWRPDQYRQKRGAKAKG